MEPELRELQSLVEKTSGQVEDFAMRSNTRIAALETRTKQLAVAVQRPVIGNDPRGAYDTAEDQAYREYLRRGVVPEQKSLSVGVDPQGGYFVPPVMSDQITKTLFDVSPVRQIANVTTISSGDALEQVLDRDEAGASWAAEQAARPATATPVIGKWRIPVHEEYAFPQATRQVIDDANFPVEPWLIGKITEKFSRAENVAFVTGDGITRPRGFASYPTAATSDASRGWGTMEHVLTGTAASLGVGTAASDKLVDLCYSLRAPYRSGGSWLMNRTTAATVRKLRDGQGNFLWAPAIVAGQPDVLLGFPVRMSEDVAAIGTGSLSIFFGNFTLGYQIVDRAGVAILRDEYTNKPFVGFYARKRVGGDVVNFETIKALKFAA